MRTEPDPTAAGLRASRPGSATVAALASLLLTLPATAAAATASQPPACAGEAVRIVVPFPQGDASDLLARVYAIRLSERWLQPVAVDNRPGANGTVGSAFVARAAPDGCTLLMGGIGPQAIAVGLYPKLDYDPLRAFEPVSLVARQQRLLVVHPTLPARSLPAFIALARARPGVIAYASTGQGSFEHLAFAQFTLATGISLRHRPFEDPASRVRALLEGEVEAALPAAMQPLQDVRAGRLRALAATGARRSPLAPEVPTLAELGHRIDLDAWHGLWVPAGAPPPVVAHLAAEAIRIAGLPDVHQRVARDALEIIGGGPDALRALLAAEIERWAKVISAARLGAD